MVPSPPPPPPTHGTRYQCSVIDFVNATLRFASRGLFVLSTGGTGGGTTRNHASIDRISVGMAPKFDLSRYADKIRPSTTDPVEVLKRSLIYACAQTEQVGQAALLSRSDKYQVLLQTCCYRLWADIRRCLADPCDWFVAQLSTWKPRKNCLWMPISWMFGEWARSRYRRWARHAGVESERVMRKRKEAMVAGGDREHWEHEVEREARASLYLFCDDEMTEATREGYASERLERVVYDSVEYRRLLHPGFNRDDVKIPWNRKQCLAYLVALHTERHMRGLSIDCPTTRT